MAGAVPGGQRMAATPSTYGTKRVAAAFHAALRAEIERGRWLPPEQGRVPLRQYADKRLKQKRATPRPRSRDQYETNLRLHIKATLGDKDLLKISPCMVRGWHAGLIAADGPGAPPVAKCYRLPHAILATAVGDELVPKSPCVLRGASIGRSAECPWRPSSRSTPSSRSSSFRLPGCIASAPTRRAKEMTTTSDRSELLDALTRKSQSSPHPTSDTVTWSTSTAPTTTARTRLDSGTGSAAHGRSGAPEGALVPRSTS